jgi:four helix bundle protein
MSQKTAFENLQVYQLSEALADLTWLIIQRWGYFEKDTIGKQLVRAADSVGANIAEGTGRGSQKDNMRFAKIARASLFEVKHWLRRAYKRNLLSETEVSEFQKILDVLLPKLSAYINSMK